jgi:hypothetical protein
MTKFSNGKITSSVIFYNRGVPNAASNFGMYASLNYSMLKQLIVYNRNNGKSKFSMM